MRFNGDWENWIKFFLKGVAVTSDEATGSAKAILSFKSKYSKILYDLHNLIVISGGKFMSMLCTKMI